MIRLPAPCLVVLVGPSGSGKSTWAAQQFRDGQVVSSDALRGMVGESGDDQRAGTDAFDVLDLVVERRLARGLVTVVDTVGLDAARRRHWRERAAHHGVACHAVVFDTAAAVCRARNKARHRPVPPRILTGQIAARDEVATALAGEGFAGIHGPDEVELVPAGVLGAALVVAGERHAGLRFGLQLPSFTWEGGPAARAGRLGVIAAAAAAAGFTSLWVMDHFLQIPQVGREWQEMLDSYTTLGFLAGLTSTARLGALVTGVTYRNVGHLAKMVATLDVLSGGRAVCGIGAAWYEREHKAYGWVFPPVPERFALLEDALQALPLLWGPGSPSFSGVALNIPEAICYPRPLQEHVPILIGGSGERRTLRLVAEYADACNLFGDAATVVHKLEVLAAHCRALGRNLADIEVTHLSTALAVPDGTSLAATASRLRPPSVSPESYLARVNGGAVSDHVGRFGRLAEAGVQTAIVNLPNVDQPGAVAAWADVIQRFR